MDMPPFRQMVYIWNRCRNGPTVQAGHTEVIMAQCMARRELVRRARETRLQRKHNMHGLGCMTLKEQQLTGPRDPWDPAAGSVELPCSESARG